MNTEVKIQIEKADIWLVLTILCLGLCVPLKLKVVSYFIFFIYKDQVSSELCFDSVSFHKLLMPQPWCLWMKQGAYWVNCSPAHIHDPLHGNQSVSMSDLTTVTLTEMLGSPCLSPQGGGDWQGEHQGWYFAYKLETGCQVGSRLYALALGTEGVAPKPLSCAVIPPKPVEFYCQTQSVSCTLVLNVYVKQEVRIVLEQKHS